MNVKEKASKSNEKELVSDYTKLVLAEYNLQQIDLPNYQFTNIFTTTLYRVSLERPPSSHNSVNNLKTVLSYFPGRNFCLHD